MRVDLFDFELPAELIAQRPAEPRDAARLLDLSGPGVVDREVRDLPSLLRAGDLLIVNDTRVLPARLRGRRESGGRVEALLLRPLTADRWHAFVKPAKRLAVGARLAFGDALSATVGGQRPDGSLELVFDRAGDALRTAIEQTGAVPLPPYIRGGTADARDLADYQTMFAQHEGSVAAPTAGLHFTPALMGALSAAGIRRAAITLHVGAGTFQPVRVEDTDAHVMHSEWAELSPATARAIADTRAAGGRVVAVGTTVLRVLESVARLHDGALPAWQGETDLFIVPGGLVSAFAGPERMKAAYAHAVAARYRFYSYGDCCLLAR